MSDLKLVPPDEPTELERRLFEAVAREAPSAEQRLRVRQALGLPSPSIAPPPAPATASSGLLLKAAVAGLAAGAVAVLLVLPGRFSKPASRAVEPSVSAAAPTLVPSAPVLLEPPVVAEEPAAPLPASQALPSRPAKKGAARVASGGAEQSGAERGDLSEQLRLIESARAAVASRQPDSALAALTTYRQRFPRGAFGQEASVLQIQAIDLQGDHARAAAQARTFLARHPNSPHVGVMQRIAGR